MQLSIGFSPCPNDTFIFDALVNKKIDTAGIDFKPSLLDVQQLNESAISRKFDITKISYGVYPKVKKDYVILNSGSALGFGVGPLLISKPGEVIHEVEQYQIAIPGEHTTAHFLFSNIYPNARDKIFMRYDEIESFVLSGRGLGVIIHENRFTYQNKGLEKITDLGFEWEKKTQSPIPLGGIVIDRKHDLKLQQQIDILIKKSIEYSITQYPKLSEFITLHAQEMNEEVMRQHIDLYVNEYSLSLGDKGKRAVVTMMNFFKNNIIGGSELPIFID
jgi:1,4-dihydroxy-6-naphthoate synthase